MTADRLRIEEAWLHKHTSIARRDAGACIPEVPFRDAVATRRRSLRGQSHRRAHGNLWRPVAATPVPCR